MTADDAKYLVPALDRGLRLLSIFTREQPELNATEISQRLELPYATTYRLLYTLERHGMLKKNPARLQAEFRNPAARFRLSPTLDIVEVARPELTALRDATGASVNLGVLEGIEMIYLAHVPSDRPLVTRLVVGSRLPAHASSIGRLMMAWMTEQQVRGLYNDFDFKAPGVQVTSLDKLIGMLAEDRRRGYVVAQGTYDVGVVAVAAPIFDRGAVPIAGVNISAPATVLDKRALDGVIKDKVLATAKAISQQLGCRDKTQGKEAVLF